MRTRNTNVVDFMIWSLKKHNSKHINIEKVTVPCTADWQKYKFSNFYKMDQLWLELYNRECGEGLTDVRNEGADIEKF